MRITGNDNEGQAQLGNFIDPESKYPVLVTTSRLLSTGVDAQTCRLIVLDRTVGSMTEFKQIVGRGTRVHEDTKKFFFTLIDFRGRRTTSPTRTSTAAGPDLRAGRRRSDHAAGRRSAGRRRTRAGPPTPGDDEVVVDGDARHQRFRPTATTPYAKIYVDGVAVSDRRRAGRVPRRGRQARHREPARLHASKALRKRFASLDDFLQRLERRPSASKRSSTSSKPRACARAAGRGGRATTSTRST